VSDLPTTQDIQRVARDVLRELTGTANPPGAERADRSGGGGGDRDDPPSRTLIGQAEVRAVKSRGETVLVVPPGAIVTPLARDVADGVGVELRYGAPGAPARPAGEAADSGPSPLSQGGPLALGSDHGGFPLKQLLKAHLEQRGVHVQDVGTHSKEACDYPDLAAEVARRVALGSASWGILVDGAGIGSCMAANKVPGVLAANCHDERTARNSREHNGANVLCLGSGTLDEAAARRVVDAWLETAFAGGRHGRRVDKIRALERSFVR
jgi:ribose 5-phosphate isomerase B